MGARTLAINASAVLLSWQRPENLAPIVEQLRGVPAIAEIVVWNNGDPNFPAMDGVQVFQSPDNRGLLARIAVAMLTKHEAIWFQDDDLVLTSAQIGQLWQAFLEQPSVIHGVQGRRLGPGAVYQGDNVFGPCDIVNQAVVVPRAAIAVACSRLPSVAWQPGSIDLAEDDIVLCLAQGRQACRAIDCGPLDRRGAYDASAWSRRPDHGTRRQAAVTAMLETRTV